MYVQLKTTGCVFSWSSCSSALSLLFVTTLIIQYSVLWSNESPEKNPKLSFLSMNELIQLLLYIHWCLLSASAQGPSAQKPVKQQDARTADESLNYATIHFGNEKMWEFFFVHKYQSKNCCTTRYNFIMMFFIVGTNRIKQKWLLCTMWWPSHLKRSETNEPQCVMMSLLHYITDSVA